MLLHEVKPKTKFKKRQPRVGRGGKRGSYSGRGVKGQKAHAGRKIRPAIYDLTMRLPKLRGFANKPIRPKPLAINLVDLQRVKGDEVNVKSLVDSGVLRAGQLRRSAGKIKVLSQGDLTKAVYLKGLSVSRAAKEKIEAVGGTVK